MDGVYELFVNDNRVGQVTVKREGLYYRFFCRIPLKMGEKYRLFLCQNGKKFCLGLMVPEQNEFVISTKLPVKQFENTSEARFILMDKEDSVYSPLDSNKPFANLNELKDGYFAIRNGEPVVMWDRQPSHNP